MPRRVYGSLKAFLADKHNPTLTDLASELDISIPYLSQIKWGERQPPLHLALKIAERCNVPLESLLRRTKAKAS